MCARQLCGQTFVCTDNCVQNECVLCINILVKQVNDNEQNKVDKITKKNQEKLINKQL